MKHRKIGQLEVSAVGLGCMGMSHGYGAPADKAEMTDLQPVSRSNSFQSKSSRTVWYGFATDSIKTTNFKIHKNMNLIKYFLVLTMASLMACSATAAKQTESDKSSKDSNMKSVIVYFTHSGNTELAAKDLASVTGVPIVRLMPEESYTSQDVDWTVESSRCTREHLDQSLRPAIKPVDINFAEVDTVFIGFPIWWHEEPAVIRTFLDNYREQLKGKTLYPFCTSYESPMSEADATLRKGYPTLDWKTGLRLPASPAKIREWINQ